MEYIEFNIGHPDMVGEGSDGVIIYWVGATVSFTNVLWNKILERF